MNLLQYVHCRRYFGEKNRYSILTHFLTSFIFSLLLPFRLLLLSWFRSSDTAADSVSLYQGTVWHERRHPVHNAFRLSARYALIDLDRVSHAPPNHLSADEARCAAKTSGPVLLLTIPPSVGYQRSPVTVYYCYDLEGSTRILKRCIVEVSNTPWCEKVLFSFNPNSDVVAKTLHVSPFMDMLGNWSIKTRSPGDNLMVTMSVHHPELGNYFTASLTAKRVSSLSVDHALFFWLMPHKAAVWTYWQALKLWWKNVPFHEHPKYDNPTYREEALVREQTLQCCNAFARDSNKQSLQVEGRGRWFSWRDAKWPWYLK